MSATLRIVTPREVRDMVSRRLGLQATQARGPTAVELAGEALRTSLWALSRRGEAPVYITRFLNVSERMVAAGAALPHAQTATYRNPADLRELFHEVLDELKTIGDVAELPGGYWLPAPTRQVDIGQNGQRLIVGGAPTSVLIQKGLSPTQLGLSRFVSNHVNGLPEERFESWTRIPNEDLAAWTIEVLESASLVPLPADAGFDFWAYAPGQGPTGSSGLQYSRWTDNLAGLRDGRYLIRYTVQHGPRNYSVGLIDHGRLTQTGTVNSGTAGTRRLLYGLDVLAGLPTSIQVFDEDEDSAFLIRSYLPPAEERLFTAIGRLQPNKDGRLYPQLWFVPSATAAAAITALKRLGVRVGGG